MKYSASELVKRSSAQLLYKEIKRIQWQATERQFKGNEYAEKIVSKHQASSEKRGIVTINNVCKLYKILIITM